MLSALEMMAHCFFLSEVVECLARVVKALGILERYGCNLLNPNRPKFWRSVKFNNPVFKASVDPVKVIYSVLICSFPVYSIQEYNMSAGF